MAEQLAHETLSELLDHLSTRRSVKAYQREEKPSRHIVRLICHVAAASPYESHDDKPPWKFIVTDDRNLISAMARALDPNDSGEPDYLLPDDPNFNDLTYFKNAPWVVVMLVMLPDKDKAPKERRDTIDYDMTVSYGTAHGSLMSAAHLAGYAAGWIGFFTAPAMHRDSLENLLGIKAPWRIHAIIPIGHAAGKSEKREINFDEIVEFR